MKIILGVSLMLLGSATSGLAAGFEIIKPHRATYEVSLGEAEERSGIKAMNGRIVYEVTGNECEGITVEYRFVTQINAGRDVFVTDQRTSTHESPDGEEFSFQTKSFVNDQADQSVIGNAKNDSGVIKVTLGISEKQELELEDAVFSTTHLVEVLQAAKAGVPFIRHDVFDGSGDADKVLSSASVIGKPKKFDEVLKGEKEQAITKLRTRDAWPVTMSYFNKDKGNTGEEMPSYEASFYLYPDGVSRELQMRYPDYTLDASLTKLEYLEASPCQIKN